MEDNLSTSSFNIMIKSTFNKINRKSSKWFPLKLFGFFVFVFILDYSIGTCLKVLYFKQDNGDIYRLTYAIRKSNEDIIILGDSRAQYHYIPSEITNKLKMSCFNAGRAGGHSVIYHYAILNSILRRHKPKMVFFNISPYELLKEEYNSEYDRLSILLPFAKQNTVFKQIVKLRGPFEPIKSLSFIYPFNSLLITLLYPNTNRIKDDNGYLPLNGTLNIPTNQEYTDNIDELDMFKSKNLDSLKLGYFKMLMNEAKTNGVRIVLIISPQSISPYPNKSTNYIKDYCINENIQFIDFSHDSVFMGHNELFYGFEHLNDKGAMVFTKMLIDSICKHQPLN